MSTTIKYKNYTVIENKYDKKSTYICEICKDGKKTLFNDKLEFNLHCWEYHPQNKIEKYWSECKQNGKLQNMTLCYQFDPYY
jgi:glutaredoxin